MSRGGALGATAIAIAVVLMATLLTGCLRAPDDGDGERVSVTLRVEFASFAPSSHAGKVVEWSQGAEGNWTVTSMTNSTDGGTVYVVRGLNATTTLDTLLTGAVAAGFVVEHHRESMGAFVDSVAGVENGRNGHYWVYYIGDEFGTVSSDRAGVSAGDVVTWVYQGSPVR